MRALLHNSWFLNKRSESIDISFSFGQRKCRFVRILCRCNGVWISRILVIDYRLRRPRVTVFGNFDRKVCARSQPRSSVDTSTPALEKGLDILELFAGEPTGLTKSDVACRLGRTISEIFRILLCLEERGYISRSRDGERFRLTLHLFKFGPGISAHETHDHRSPPHHAKACS